VREAVRFADLFDCAGCLLAGGTALLIAGCVALAWAMTR
jgi:hypothetical protein